MATRKKAKYSRVYPSDGSWYWVVPGSNKWVRLCTLIENDVHDVLLLERLAAAKRKHTQPEGSGDVRPLINQYVRDNKASHKEKAWPAYGRYAGNALRNAQLAKVNSTVVYEVLKAWKGKLPMQRAMRGFLSGFFQWCIEHGRMQTNPCREVKLKKPKPRSTYMTDAHFAAIRAAMLENTYERAGKVVTAVVPTGAKMQCLMDLFYLTLQRSTEVRNLQHTEDPNDPWCSWVDTEAGVIHFRPSKTEDSSGVVVDLKITPEIQAVLERAALLGKADGKYVFQTRDDTPYAANTVLKAFKMAKKRAGLEQLKYTVKDIRAKALTDGLRDGYDMKVLQTAGAHTNEQMTEDYIKLRNVPSAKVRLRIPEST